MAKSIVLGILEETLGEYVELSRDKLKMAVWSGEVELRDLALKSTALERLDLPIHVVYGSLTSLRLSIPWKKLGETPVRIVMDGLLAQIGPANDRLFTAEDLRRHSSELRRKILERAEAIAYAYISAELSKREMDQAAGSTQKKKTKKWGWFTTLGLSYAQRLIAKVLANVELNFRNIHFRYEDGVAVPGCHISAGVTIEKLLVATTDSRWVEKPTSSVVAAATNAVNAVKRTLFPARPGVGVGVGSGSGGTRGAATGSSGGDDDVSFGADQGGLMYKMTTLCNLAVYWNTTSYSLEEMARTNPARWQATMVALIYREDNRLDPTALNYVLSPPTLVSIKLSHNENLVGRLADEAAAAAAAASAAAPTSTGSHHSGAGAGAGGAGAGGRVARGSVDEERLPAMADVVVDIGHIAFATDHEQLSQLVAVLDAFAVVQRQRHLFLFRPAERPTTDPRAWWLYAYKLLTARDDILYHRTDVLRRCMTSKDRYKYLVSRTVVRPSEVTKAISFVFGGGSTTAAPAAREGDASVYGHAESDSAAALQSQWMNALPETASLSTAERAEMARFESMLPLQVLIAYRQQAVTETLIAAYQSATAGRPPAAAAAPAASGQAVLSLQLPDGWTTQFDPASNNMFHANAATGGTQWELPVGAALVAMLLPYGWEQRVDPATERAFYACPSTGMTQWTLPEGSAAAPAPPQVTALTLPRGWEQKVDLKQMKVVYVGRHGAVLEPPPGTQHTNLILPQFWEQRLDPASGKHFYFNGRTGVALWAPPPDATQVKGESKFGAIKRLFSALFTAKTTPKPSFFGGRGGQPARTLERTAGDTRGEPTSYLSLSALTGSFGLGGNSSGSPGGGGGGSSGSMRDFDDSISELDRDQVGAGPYLGPYLCLHLGN